ncbi:Deoxyuridine 5'-triphosphate nucleotidohydrolase [Orchesella cincta]|uniref:Deoxyuridine 5'-triphosphate nucleotidohydrolase n=1 Tax=Orchesella cincta TaxID=48709 RepID=A0A1D2MTH2_ORCCI|nr:Deoxyuridine 5'-triphosphate nucleotidohydrolase [Orchesella cincta]
MVSLLVAIYFQKFLLPVYHGSTSDEVQAAPSLKLFLLCPIIFNSFQIVMAFNLLSAAGKRCEPIIAFAKSNTWFQFSTVMLALLIIKLFFVLWFSSQIPVRRKDIFGVSLIVLETVFKIFGLFIVKEFIDDLKSVLNVLPTPHYYCIYTTAPPPPMAPSPTVPNIAMPSIPYYPQSSTTTQTETNRPRVTISQNRNSAVITV